MHPRHAPVKLPIVVEKEPALVQIWEQRCRGGGCERNGKQSQCTTQVKNQTSSHRGTKSSVSFVNCVILRSLPTHPRWLCLMDRREMPAHLSLRVSGFLVVKRDLCMKREICRESPILCRETAYLYWGILDLCHIFGLGKCGRRTTSINYAEEQREAPSPSCVRFHRHDRRFSLVSAG